RWRPCRCSSSMTSAGASCHSTRPRTCWRLSCAATSQSNSCAVHNFDSLVRIFYAEFHDGSRGHDSYEVAVVGEEQHQLWNGLMITTHAQSLGHGCTHCPALIDQGPLQKNQG